jgi:ABC-type transport system involved in cytochrome c biogenesis ATPase subunit
MSPTPPAGQQRRIGIATVLTLKTKVWMVDELTAGQIDQF